MNRREFIAKSTVLAAMTQLPDLRHPVFTTSSNTTFIANYDTESPSCLEHLEGIVQVHLKHEIPATFFIVSDILNDASKQRVVKLLDHPLFEVGSHSKSHQLILPHPLNPKTGNPREQLIDSKKRLEDIFGREMVGYATPYAYVDGFKGHKDILSIVKEAGYKYISTMCWGPGFSLPAPILEPFTYHTDGFPDIWEIPKHGWHENVLKGHTNVDTVALLNWPSPWPEGAIPKKPIDRPEQETEVNKVFIDLARAQAKKHLTLAWHPWSIGRFDPRFIALDSTFAYVKKIKMKTDTFHGLYKTLKA
jgi:peptidoglycan/xylan/chitin deacetylase (PgdA/CDA1 family)